MKRRLFPAATVLAAVISLFIYTTPAHSKADASNLKPKRPAAAASALNAPGRTVFDGSHNEIFSPVNKGELDYSDFADMFKAAGSDVAVSSGSISAQSLEGVRTYVIAGPTKALGMHELDVMRSFVEKGGNLLVLLHISSPVAYLTEDFGILVSNFVLGEQEGNIDGRAEDFLVTRFTPHPVTKGLKKIAVYGTWGLKAQTKATEVATTSDKAWADINRDRKYDEGEPIGKFGIIAVSGVGSGKVVVVADDAPFANRFLGEADNNRLAGNIIGWFGE